MRRRVTAFGLHALDSARHAADDVIAPYLPCNLAMDSPTARFNPAFSWSALPSVLESCYLRIPKEA
jgi:hypothetical protein